MVYLDSGNLYKEKLLTLQLLINYLLKRSQFFFCFCFLVIQWSFLLLCLASIWIKNNGVSAWMLMGGVAASRLGLWMFDLSVIQQMQVY